MADQSALEKGLVVLVDDRLIDLINRIHQKIVDDGKSWQLPIYWSFGHDGIYANGYGNGIEFGASVGTNPKTGIVWDSVTFREIGRHDNDDWEVHPLDHDYENWSS